MVGKWAPPSFSHHDISDSTPEQDELRLHSHRSDPGACHHFLRFDFLNADNISPLLRKPTKEPFSFRGSDAIGIARDHSKHRASAPAHSTRVSGVVKQTSLAMTTERTSAGGFSRVFQTVLLPSVTGTISRPLSVIDPHKRHPIITTGRVAMIWDYPA